MNPAPALLISLFFSFVTLVGAATAQPLNASQRQSLEKEMEMLVSGMRAVAGCPNLIEDWEYSVLQDAASNVTYQLLGTYYLPASQKRSLYTKADANPCTSPTTKLEAAKLRVYAHSRWLGLSRAFLREPACPRPSPGAVNFLKAVEKDVIQTYQRKRAPGPSFAEIDAFSKNIAPALQEACQGSSLYFKAQTTTLAPLSQMEVSRLDTAIREREFDFNSGFTLGVGDAPDPHWARRSGVTAKRSRAQTRREVVAKHSACGGIPLKNPLGFTLEVKCIARLKSNGSMQIEIIPKNPEIKLISVGLKLLDLKTGKPVASEHTKAEKNGRTATVAGAMTLLKQSAPYDQVQISLTLTDRRGDTAEIPFHYARDIEGPATVAAVDFIKAAQYAFAPEKQDLSAHGIVSRNAKAFELEGREKARQFPQ